MQICINTYMNYYVYAYIRSYDSPTARAGTPYYIGKGTGNRAYVDHRDAKNNAGVHTPKNTVNIVVLEDNLTELGAFALERRMIRWYGRKDNGTGVLHNRTDGGEGASGHKHSVETRKIIGLASKSMPVEVRQRIGDKNRGKIRSEETKQKMREINIGKTMSDGARHKMSLAKQNMSEETKQKMRNKIVSQETREKMSLAAKGKPNSAEHNINIGLSRLGEKRKTIECPHCHTLGGEGSMHRWHFEKCKEKL